MTGIILVELITNAVCFTFLFWILTFIAKRTYSNKFYNYKLNFYECGFKNFSKNNISFDVNFILVILFILIYDGEFFVLLPFSLNTDIISYETIFLFFFFYLWLILALFFDFAFQGLDWQVIVCGTTFLIKRGYNKKKNQLLNLNFFYNFSVVNFFYPGKYIIWSYVQAKPYSKLKTNIND